MKKIIFLFFILTQSIFAQNGFEEGNALYQKEKYAEAATAYESVLKSGKQSAGLYFNLANSYYKMNKVAPAIYNYEKALLLDPNNKDIRNNLTFAQKLTIDEVKEVPRVGFSKMVRDFTGNYSYDFWAWISVGFAFGFLLFFVGYYFSQTVLSKRIFFIGMFAIVFAILISVLAALFEKDHFQSEKPAIVFAEIAGVKSEPKSAAADAFVLHEGTKVMVKEKMASWTKIQLPDETSGWIESSAIKEIK